MLVVSLFALAAALIVAGVFVVAGPGFALVAAGGCLAAAAYDLSTDRP